MTRAVISATTYPRAGELCGADKIARQQPDGETRRSASAEGWTLQSPDRRVVWWMIWRWGLWWGWRIRIGLRGLVGLSRRRTRWLAGPGRHWIRRRHCGRRPGWRSRWLIGHPGGPMRGSG